MNFFHWNSRNKFSNVQFIHHYIQNSNQKWKVKERTIDESIYFSDQVLQYRVISLYMLEQQDQLNYHIIIATKYFLSYNNYWLFYHIGHLYLLGFFLFLTNVLVGLDLDIRYLKTKFEHLNYLSRLTNWWLSKQKKKQTDDYSILPYLYSKLHRIFVISHNAK
jgi:hypothetical protein